MTTNVTEKKRMTARVADVSAVIITLDEAANIDACLHSLAWCREIIVVDSGSTDRTLEICQEHGARILSRAFDGYGTQKQYAVSQATREWVLSIDADEIITPELAAEIQAAIMNPACTHSAFYLRFQIEFMGRRLRFGPTRNETHLRLFRRSAGTFGDAIVHESVSVGGTAGRLTHQVVHRPYGTLAGYFAKFNRYTSAVARNKLNGGKTTSAAAVAVRAPITFLDAYLLRGGFLDGYPGFLFCFLHAVYHTIKYAKLLELQRGKP